MASLTSHLQKVFHRHVPMIRFRYGLNRTKKHPPPTMTSSAKHTTAPISNSGHSKPAQKPSSLAFSETPKKYRRKLLTQDEIDLIATGGH